MSKQHYQHLFAYSWHTTQQLLDKAAVLDEAELHAPSDFVQRSMHNSFFHIIATSRNWRTALETGTQPPHMQSTGFESVEELRHLVEEEASAWQQLLAQLSDEEVDGNVNLTSLRGESMSIPRWLVMQHLILHAMQHHTELAALLTNKGLSPGDIDLIFYRG
jgi:uncharacterized damage-inducible protein DinB